eukprot:scaffold8001_cov125-Isochrysis_galbana.AAC.4
MLLHRVREPPKLDELGVAPAHHGTRSHVPTLQPTGEPGLQLRLRAREDVDIPTADTLLILGHRLLLIVFRVKFNVGDARGPTVASVHEVNAPFWDADWREERGDVLRCHAPRKPAQLDDSMPLSQGTSRGWRDDGLLRRRQHDAAQCGDGVKFAFTRTEKINPSIPQLLLVELESFCGSLLRVEDGIRIA